MVARSLFFALAIACTGPRPSAEVLSVAPSPVPGQQRVTLEVRNEGRHGEVTLEITLVAADGDTLRDTRVVETEAGDRLTLTFDVPAPANTYTATVEARYPD